MAEDGLTDDGIFDAEYTPQPKKEPPPAYRIYEDSRIAVSQNWGKLWKTKLDAALAAYDNVYQAWDQACAYYNNNQTNTPGMQTSRGVFRRGDNTENVVYSNVNVLLPAVYMKDPDIAVSTIDGADEEFSQTLQKLLNTLFRRRDMLNAKSKIKKAVGFGILTNCGVLKLDFEQKDTSAEIVNESLKEISAKLKDKGNSIQDLEKLYGQLEALEAQMEVAVPSGPRLMNKLPWDVIVDPYAEAADGSDANWMIERVFLSTSYLQARFTRETEDGSVYVYQPTHKASFNTAAENSRDDGLGLVLEALNASGNVPQSNTPQERLNYLYTYMSECYFVWDKTTRRVALFHRDDWSWPLWVWDDPHQTSRFFPYFFITFSLSLGAMTSVGETSYYLDQQDEINDINRQMSKIRRTVFDFFFYNSNKLSPDDAEVLARALKGDKQAVKRLFGLKLEDGQTIKDAFEALLPPSANYEGLFNKEPIKNAINEITNTSDALRGVQFKTNTNQAAVQTYQDAVRLSVGAKVDSVEDTVADVAQSLAEWCVQNLGPEEVAGLIGEKSAVGWRTMSLGEFRSQFSLTIVAGSMEKPNSIWRKKEAIELAQSVGQFAQAAPGAVLKVMLKLLQKAYTDLILEPEDWDGIDEEISANLTKGVSTPGATGAPPKKGAGEGAASAQGGLPPEAIEQLKQLPPEIKQQAMQMQQAGESPDRIVQFLMEQAQGAGAPEAQ